MDLSKSPESENFVDKTANTPLDRFVDSLLMKLNPVVAVRNAKGRMIEAGWIQPIVNDVFGREKTPKDK